MLSFRDSPNIPCIIITEPSTANKEDCGIKTNNSANEPTDSPTPYQTCQPETTTSLTLKNLKHIASPIQETNCNKDIVITEMNGLSPNKNSKSPEEIIGLHKTGNRHQTNINTNKKTTNQKRLL